MKKGQLFWNFGIFLIVGISGGMAQICGNPIGATQKGVLTMSLNGTYQHVSDPVQNIISKRIFFKTQWGLASGLDIYGLLGNVQLGLSRINAPSTLTDYEDKYRFSYGVGFTSTLGGFSLSPSSPPPRSKLRARQRKPSPPVHLARIFAGGHVIRYPSESAYEDRREILNYTVIHQYAMKYDVVEATGYAGIAIPYRVFRLYVGGVGWGIQRKEQKTEYLLGASDEKVKLGKESGRYQSGLWTGALVGIQWNLPQQYMITVEAIGFNSQNYQIMIGISQSGWQ